MESAARQEIEDRMRESILECIRLSACERGDLRERHVQVLCSAGLQTFISNQRELELARPASSGRELQTKWK